MVSQGYLKEGSGREGAGIGEKGQGWSGGQARETDRRREGKGGILLGERDRQTDRQTGRQAGRHITDRRLDRLDRQATQHANRRTE